MVHRSLWRLSSTCAQRGSRGVARADADLWDREISCPGAGRVGARTG